MRLTFYVVYEGTNERTERVSIVWIPNPHRFMNVSISSSCHRTPTPEREKRRKGDKRTPSPECDELRRLRELKEMQELTVKEDEKYVKEPLDPKLFEWDTKVIRIV